MPHPRYPAPAGLSPTARAAAGPAGRCPRVTPPRPGNRPNHPAPASRVAEVTIRRSRRWPDKQPRQGGDHGAASQSGAIGGRPGLRDQRGRARMRKRALLAVLRKNVAGVQRSWCDVTSAGIAPADHGTAWFMGQTSRPICHRIFGFHSDWGIPTWHSWTGRPSTPTGLARHVTTAGVRVVEADCSDRQDRRRAGAKSDPLDAVSAARAAQSGRARGAPKGRDGTVEAIRALMVAKRSARADRTQTINQARSLIVTGPQDLRARFARHTWYRCRATLGRRWGGYLGLVLLIGLIGGVALGDQQPRPAGPSRPFSCLPGQHQPL